MQKLVVFNFDYEYSFYLHYPRKDNIELDLLKTSIHLVRKLLGHKVPKETCVICSQFLITLSKDSRFCILNTNTYPKWGNMLCPAFGKISILRIICGSICTFIIERAGNKLVIQPILE